MEPRVLGSVIHAYLYLLRVIDVCLSTICVRSVKACFHYGCAACCDRYRNTIGVSIFFRTRCISIATRSAAVVEIFFYVFVLVYWVRQHKTLRYMRPYKNTEKHLSPLMTVALSFTTIDNYIIQVLSATMP